MGAKGKKEPVVKKEPDTASSLSNGYGNGHAIPRKPVPSRTPQTASSFRRLISVGIRLSFWYAVVVALFTCPSDLRNLTADSSAVCKPYLTARDFTSPYVSVYYDRYAAPYVDAAQPYLETANREVVFPAYTYGRQSYDKFGAPQIEKIRTLGKEQWATSVKPQLDIVRSQAKNQYNVSVGPHVDQAWAAAFPYYVSGRDRALSYYDEYFLPMYAASLPYVQQGYDMAYSGAMNTGLPYAKMAWGTTTVFVERSVWPKIRILYGQNVEPQLMRISERLGRYRDSKRLRAEADSADGNPEEAEAVYSSAMSAASSFVAEQETVSPATEKTTPESTPTLSKDEEASIVREKIEDDLNQWQDKFAKAADKGSDDLQERITDITSKQIDAQVQGVGSALMVQLEEAAEASCTALKKAILKIVKSLPKEPSRTDRSTAEEEWGKAVRSAGLTVRKNAQDVRLWKKKFDEETQSLVDAAAESTLQVIDDIRDLGLQEIGMRWAWMEGVTYKDWSRYHELKNSFSKTLKEIEAVARDHEGLTAAKEASDEVVGNAMAIAEDAAKELSRLKSVGLWKIQASDATDEFSTKIVNAKVAVGAQSIKEKMRSASESVIGTSQSPGESIASKVREKASAHASAASTAIYGGEPGIADQASEAIIGTPHPAAESIGSAASASASSASSAASSAVSESLYEPISSAAETLASTASSAIIGTPKPEGKKTYSSFKDQAEQVILEASKSVVGTSTPPYEAFASDASEVIMGSSTPTYKSVASEVSESFFSTSSAASSAFSDYSSSFTDSASSASSVVSKRVSGGAMAQEFEGRVPIFDAVINEEDDDTYSAKLNDIVSEAGKSYTHATQAVLDAMFKATPTQGTLQSMTSVANAQFSSALAAASSAIYGPEPGLTDQIGDAIQDRYAAAVAAASSILYNTPTPAYQSLAARASSSYAEAVAQIEGQYNQAMSVASAQISGTPKLVHEEMFSSISSAYSGSLDSASSRLNEAISKASEGIYGPTPGPLESVSSIASARLADSLAAASAQYSSLRSQYGPTHTPLSQQYLAEGQRRYHEAIGLAHVRYSEFFGAASTALYGTKTPIYESAYSKASETIIGTPAPAYQSMIDSAQKAYSDSVAAASSNLVGIMDKVRAQGEQTAKPPLNQVLAALESASVQYSSLVSVASATLASASSAASSAIYGPASGSPESVSMVISEKYASVTDAASSIIVGTPAPWSEAAASQASANWQALISRASEQVYGQPAPFTESVYSQATSAYAQATGAAVAQYAAVAALFSEVLTGKEPAYTDSIMSRLNAAYSGAGSYASEAYASVSSAASEGYESASSIVTTIFTPPAKLEAILADATEQVNAVVEAASVQVYGTQKGTFERATDAAASQYSGAASRISESVYGTPVGSLGAAQSSVAAAAQSAMDAISSAFYGTSMGTTESISSRAAGAYASASSAAADTYSSAANALGDGYAAASAKVKTALYGEEKTAFENAQDKLNQAIQSANARIAEMYAEAAKRGGETVENVKESVESVASQASSVVADATARVKDEL